jgi:hypothetical protein
MRINIVQKSLLWSQSERYGKTSAKWFDKSTLAI